MCCRYFGRSCYIYVMKVSSDIEELGGVSNFPEKSEVFALMKSAKYSLIF